MLYVVRFFNSLWDTDAICCKILVITDSGNGLLPDWHQAITWTDDDLLSLDITDDKY